MIQILSRFTIFVAFRHRNFRLFWFGQFVSLNGSWMQIVALNWLTYRLTDSPLYLGLINFVALLPVGFVSLVGGAIGDRLPKHRIVIFSQSVLILLSMALAFLTYTGYIEIWHLFIAVFLIGSFDALEQPARFGFLMDIVEESDLTNAIGLTSSITNLGRTIGPVTAGIMISQFGEASCFLVNALTYLAVVGSFLLMRLKDSTAKIRKPIRFKKDWSDAFRYFFGDKVILSLLILVAIASFLTRSHILLMPVFSSDVYFSGSKVYGLLMGSVGVGSLFGALLAAGLQTGRRGQWLVFSSLLTPAFLFLFSFSQSVLLSLPILFFVSTFQFVQLVLSRSLLQLNVNKEFFGRIGSLFALTNIGFARLGGIQAGAIAEYWSAPSAVFFCASLGFLGILFLILINPDIRKIK